MILYRLLDRLPWVRSTFERKLGTVVFLGSFSPLATYVGTVWINSGRIETGLVLVLGCLGLIGFIMTYMFVRGLLAPLDDLSESLRAHLERREREPLPVEHEDLIGGLLRDAEYMVQNAQQMANQIQLHSQDDVLTGVHTRRGSEFRLAEDLARADRHRLSLHLVFVQVHGLAEHSAQHGHGAADALLAHAATLLKLNVRKTDWVGRWSDQIFVLGYCDNKRIEHTLERLIAILEQSPLEFADGAHLAIQVTCGAAAHPQGPSIDDLVRSANQALVEANTRLGSKRQRALKVIAALPPKDDPRPDPTQEFFVQETSD